MPVGDEPAGPPPESPPWVSAHATPWLVATATPRPTATTRPTPGFGLLVPRGSRSLTGWGLGSALPSELSRAFQKLVKSVPCKSLIRDSRV